MFSVLVTHICICCNSSTLSVGAKGYDNMMITTVCLWRVDSLYCRPDSNGCQPPVHCQPFHWEDYVPEGLTTIAKVQTIQCVAWVKIILLLSSSHDIWSLYLDSPKTKTTNYPSNCRWLIHLSTRKSDYCYQFGRCQSAARTPMKHSIVASPLVILIVCRPTMK